MKMPMVTIKSNSKLSAFTILKVRFTKNNIQMQQWYIDTHIHTSRAGIYEE